MSDDALKGCFCHVFSRDARDTHHHLKESLAALGAEVVQKSDTLVCQTLTHVVVTWKELCMGTRPGEEKVDEMFPGVFVVAEEWVWESCRMGRRALELKHLLADVRLGARLLAEEKEPSVTGRPSISQSCEVTGGIPIPGVREASPWEGYGPPSQLSPSPVRTKTRSNRVDASFIAPKKRKCSVQEAEAEAQMKEVTNIVDNLFGESKKAKENTCGEEEENENATDIATDIATDSAGKAKPNAACFVLGLSGMNSKERARCQTYADKCGLVISESKTKEWSAEITHLIAPQMLGRSEKTLAAMASGAWILTENWLRACARAKEVVDETNYSAGQTPTVSEMHGLLLAKGAAKVWRRHFEETQERAFEGIQAQFHERCAQNTPSIDTLIRIFTAGGGKVVDCVDRNHASSDFLSKENENFKFAVVPDTKRESDGISDQHVLACHKRGVIYVTDLFIVEWLAFPKKDLRVHVRSPEEFISDMPEGLRMKWLQKLQDRLAA